MKKQQKNREKGWGFYIAVLITFGLLSMIFAGILSAFSSDSAAYPSGNVALIPVKGFIVGDAATGLISESYASSTDIVKMIENAEKNPSIKAIIIEIDSPGGMAVPSDEIGQAVKRANKTTVAWIRSAGASGAYWIASAADRIYANRMSAVGSIGVIGSYLDFSEFIQEYNVSYERLVSGEYKDMGSPFRDLEPDERQILQDMIDKMREFFIIEVSKNRNLGYDTVEELATGRIYLGHEAKGLGLIDNIGGKPEIKQYLRSRHNLTSVEIAEYRTQKSFFDLIGSIFSRNSFYIGKGIGDSLVEKGPASGSPLIFA